MSLSVNGSTGSFGTSLPPQQQQQQEQQLREMIQQQLQSASMAPPTSLRPVLESSARPLPASSLSSSSLGYPDVQQSLQFSAPASGGYDPNASFASNSGAAAVAGVSTYNSLAGQVSIPIGPAGGGAGAGAGAVGSDAEGGYMQSLQQQNLMQQQAMQQMQMQLEMQQMQLQQQLQYPIGMNPSAALGPGSGIAGGSSFSITAADPFSRSNPNMTSTTSTSSYPLPDPNAQYLPITYPSSQQQPSLSRQNSSSLRSQSPYRRSRNNQSGYPLAAGPGLPPTTTSNRPNSRQSYRDRDLHQYPQGGAPPMHRQGSTRSTYAALAKLTPITSLADLLNVPSLEVYFQAFVSEGFGDLAVILSLSPEQWPIMLAQVGLRAEALGTPMLQAHEALILSRLQGEVDRRNADPHAAKAAERQAKRQAEALARERELLMKQVAATGGAPGAGGMIEMATLGDPNSPYARHQMQLQQQQQQRDPHGAAAARAILCQGCNCFEAHWLCCFVVFVIVLAVSLGLWGMHKSLAPNASSSAAGAWSFVEVLFILGFVLSGLAFLVCIVSMFKQPNERPCERLYDCCCTSCAQCWDECQCSIQTPECDCDCDCSCLDCCSCGFGACFQLCIENMFPKDCCSSIECAACQACTCCQSTGSCCDNVSCCKYGACDGCFDSCVGCCDSCDGCCEGACDGVCDGCCECEAPCSGDCSCDCLPNCEDNGCLGTCYKVLCCKCKIQLS